MLYSLFVLINQMLFTLVIKCETEDLRFDNDMSVRINYYLIS